MELNQSETPSGKRFLHKIRVFSVGIVAEPNSFFPQWVWRTMIREVEYNIGQLPNNHVKFVINLRRDRSKATRKYWWCCWQCAYWWCCVARSLVRTNPCCSSWLLKSRQWERKRVKERVQTIQKTCLEMFTTTILEMVVRDWWQKWRKHAGIRCHSVSSSTLSNNKGKAQPAKKQKTLTHAEKEEWREKCKRKSISFYAQYMNALRRASV